MRFLVAGASARPHSVGMKVVLCQIDLSWEDPAANEENIRSLLAARDDLGGALIVLPEMMATGFSMDVSKVTAGEPLRSESFIESLARTHKATVLGGFGVRGGGTKGRNVAVAIDAHGRRLASYTKIHPFTFGGESNYYEAGEAIVTFECGGLTVCPFICYDLRFPELFRGGVKARAELFCVIANWPIKRVEHWVTLLRARAIENQAYVVGVNRCGEDPSFIYPGRSLVVDPHGVIIADAGGVETVVACEIEPQVVREWREAFPALADMR